MSADSSSQEKEEDTVEEAPPNLELFLKAFSPCITCTDEECETANCRHA